MLYSPRSISTYNSNVNHHANVNLNLNHDNNIKNINNNYGNVKNSNQLSFTSLSKSRSKSKDKNNAIITNRLTLQPRLNNNNHQDNNLKFNLSPNINLKKSILQSPQANTKLHRNRNIVDKQNNYIMVNSQPNNNVSQQYNLFTNIAKSKVNHPVNNNIRGQQQQHSPLRFRKDENNIGKRNGPINQYFSMQSPHKMQKSTKRPQSRAKVQKFFNEAGTLIRPSSSTGRPLAHTLINDNDNLTSQSPSHNTFPQSAHQHLSPIIMNNNNNNNCQYYFQHKNNTNNNNNININENSTTTMNTKNTMNTNTSSNSNSNSNNSILQSQSVRNSMEDVNTSRTSIKFDMTPCL